MNPRRLAPVFVALTLFLGSVAALEWTASHQEPRYVTVSVVATGDPAMAVETATDHSWQGSEPTGPEHSRARALLRRGDLAGAADIYAELVAETDVPVSLLTETAYAMRRADRCEEAFGAVERAVEAAPADGSVLLSRALTLRCLDRPEDTRQAFAAALDAQPNHSLTQLAYADFLNRHGDPTGALRILIPASTSGSNEERARALERLGRLYYELGDADSGRRALFEAIERSPTSVALWISAARTLLESDQAVDHAAALRHADAASRLAPDLSDAYDIAGRALEKLGRAEDALERYRRAAELDPGGAFVRQRIVRLALSLGEERLATKAARELTELEPDNAESQFLAALAASRIGEVDAAREAYRTAIETRNGDYAEALYNLGLLERQAGDLEASEAAYRQALDLRPDYAEAWNNLGLVMHQGERWEDAVAAFSEATRIDPEYTSAWINTARTYAAQDDYASAADALEKALEREPTDRTARLRLGVAYRRTGRIREAIGVYEDLLEDEPRYVNGWFNLAIALSALGDDARAREAYEAALGFDPDHQSSLKNLGLLEARVGRFAEAMAWLEDALDHDPGDVEARLALADVALRMGDAARCAREARNLLAHSPDTPGVAELTERCPPAE